jgi:hypothetical protein
MQAEQITIDILMHDSDIMIIQDHVDNFVYKLIRNQDSYLGKMGYLLFFLAPTKPENLDRRSLIWLALASCEAAQPKRKLWLA